MQDKNLQVYRRISKIFGAADGKIGREGVCLDSCEQAWTVGKLPGQCCHTTAILKNTVGSSADRGGVFLLDGRRPACVVILALYHLYPLPLLSLFLRIL